MSSSRICSALLLAWALAALPACRWRPEATTAPCDARFAIAPPAGTQFAAGQRPAVSPDGSSLAVVATDAGGASRLWIQSLPGSAEPLAGTDGASFPFWSPDGRRLGFFADGRLHVIDRAGTGRRALADAADPHGGSWGGDGTIIFSAGGAPSILTVPPDGGAPRHVTNAGGPQRSRDLWPAFLPDSTHFLYWSIDANHEGSVLLGSLRSSDRDRVLDACSPVAYVTSGALLCGWGGALRVWPFDPNVFQTYGRASVIAHPVARGAFGLASFGASADGSVVVYGDAASIPALQGLRSCGGGIAALVLR